MIALESSELPKSLQPLEELLRSNFLNELPLELFGLELFKVVEMIAYAPSRVGAFIFTLLELSRNFTPGEQNFYFASLRSYLELNNNYFEVKHSSDGKAFTAIGKVNGAGNSTTVKDYSFADEKPRLGDNYYRLKQTDEDGKFVYSYVVHASFDGKPRTSSYAVYPNPLDGKHLYFDNATEDFSVSLQDITGNVIFKSNVSAENSSLDISALQLSPGFYFVHTHTKSESQIHKLIVK